MSNKSRDVLKKEDPIYYKENRHFFLTDKQDIKERKAEKLKIKRLNQTLSEKIELIALNSDITFLQKRIFIFNCKTYEIS